jgi:hypothetical protein
MEKSKVNRYTHTWTARIQILLSLLGPYKENVTPGPVWNLIRGGLCAYYEIIVEGLVSTLVIKGGLDQHIRLLESMPPSPG